MGKYFCEFCNKTLPNDKLRSRKMHCRGAKHTLMRKAYYMEAFEQENIASEIKSILRSIEAHIKVDGANLPQNSTQVFQFRLPPTEFPPDFVVPKEPIGFSLPSEFNFYDRRNFPEDLGESIRKYT